MGADKSGTKKREFPKAVEPLILDTMSHLLLERRRSLLTVEAYARDLQEFGDYLAGMPSSQSPIGKLYPQLGKATTSDVRRYVMDLSSKRNYSSVTIRRKLSSIKALYKYLVLAGIRADNPASPVSGPALEKK